MLLPAFIYYIMNRLSFVSIKRIDAGTFTVCAQLKILTTASFSFLILQKKFSSIRIYSLIQLAFSCIIISHYAATYSTTNNNNQNNDDNNNGFSSFMVGLLAVLTEVTLSGLISVYYEKVLKDDKNVISVWDRNVQLATFSIFFLFSHFL